MDTLIGSNQYSAAAARGDANLARGRSYARPAVGSPKVVVIPLCIDQLFRTDGTTSPKAFLYDLAELRTIGPMIKQLRVHYVAEDQSSALFQARVSLQSSVLGRVWATAVQLLAHQVGGQTGVVGGWYTLDANFGLNIRASIDPSNVSVGAIEGARLSVFLEIELKS